MWSFETDPEYQEKLDWARAFVREEIEPIDVLFQQDELYNVNNESVRAIVKPLMQKVRDKGLWACHLPESLGGNGYGQLKLALLNEVLGRSFAAPTVFGTAAPDTGNAEILAHFGTEAQKKTYLQPLLDGDIVSCYSMTEPQGGSDPKQFKTRAVRQPDGTWRLNGYKWYSSNARFAALIIVFAVTNPDVPVHEGASLFIIPAGHEGVKILRNAGNPADPPGVGCEGYIHYDNVRLTDADLLGGVGDAFKIAQTRLGGGRIHHAMRSVAQAQKAFDWMCTRALSRFTQGTKLSEKQMVQDVIAESWMAIQQFRLFVLHTAWKIDKVKNYREVREDIAAAKTLAAKIVIDTVTKAMHIHGSLGLSNEMQFGDMLARGFIMGVADGPDEVHKITIAKQILRKYHADEGVFPDAHLLRQVTHAMDKYHSELQLPGFKSPWIEHARKLRAEGLIDC